MTRRSTKPFPEAEPAEPISGLDPNPLTRTLRSGRKAISGDSVARGVVLFAALVGFTLLYALVLQWLSDSGPDNGATRSQPVTATAKAPQGRSALPVPAAFSAVDDGPTAGGLVHFSYTGAWQHIHGLYDGRSQGTSSRTYHIGAIASFDFTGERLKLFGVKGPGGGYAELRIDGETYGLLRFYARHKEAGTLVYASPALPAGRHLVQIVVAQAPDGLPKRRFVNIDGAAYAAR